MRSKYTATDPRPTTAIRFARSCLHCGTEYLITKTEHERGQNLYCSRQCHAAHRTKPTNKASCVCAHCGVTFAVFKSALLKSKGQYCTTDCRAAAVAKGTHRTLPRVDVTCRHCGALFDTNALAAAHDAAPYCSDACAKAVKAAHPTKVERTCETCGTAFMARMGHVKIGKARFCSRACTPRAKSAEDRAYLSQVRTGMTFSDEHRANLKKAWETRPPMSAEMLATLRAHAENRRGKTRDPEIGRKISAALKGRPLSAEHRAILSEVHKGFVMPDATKEKLRLSSTGRKHTPDEVQKMSLGRRGRHKGADHYNWKGGVSYGKGRMYDSRYHLWRKAVLERDAYVCQICGLPCDTWNRRPNAHHIFEYALYTSLRFDPDNGICLDRACHRELHGLTPTPVTFVDCACGCGQSFQERSLQGKRRRYLNGHQNKRPMRSHLNETA